MILFQVSGWWIHIIQRIRYLNLPLKMVPILVPSQMLSSPGVEVLPNYRVTEITKKEVKMRKKSGEEMPLGPEDPVPLCSLAQWSKWTEGGNCTGCNGDCALLIPSTLRTLPYGWLSDWQLVEHANRKMYYRIGRLTFSAGVMPRSP